ncbi:unnamed protein product, partial [Chrysoparadoxa australica]
MGKGGRKREDAITRDIVRDLCPSKAVTHGERTTHAPAWRFVLAALRPHGRSGDPPVRARILDALLMSEGGGGQPDAYYFSAANGVVKRKAERHLSLKKIAKDFTRKAASQALRSNITGSDMIVAVALLSSGIYMPMTSAEL